jgi:hypothetical protein
VTFKTVWSNSNTNGICYIAITVNKEISFAVLVHVYIHCDKHLICLNTTIQVSFSHTGNESDEGMLANG